MADSVSKYMIDMQEALPTAQDYYALRTLGLQTVIQLASRNWTDYNEHDPGITILEALAYALTDLGYRLDFPMQDLLTPKNLHEGTFQDQFQTAREALTSDPVTLNDFRKLMIDQPHVINAWVQPSSRFAPIRGLYEVKLQLAKEYLNQADPPTLHALKQKIHREFIRHRNLGEDLDQVIILETKYFYLELQIVLLPEVEVYPVLGRVIVELESWMAPHPQFNSLSRQAGVDRDDYAQVFEGPPLQHGFLGTDDLQLQVRQLDPDQAIHLVEDLPGVVNVQHLAFSPQPPQRLETTDKPLSPLAIEPSRLQASGKVEIINGDEIAAIDPKLNLSSITVWRGDLLFSLKTDRLESEIQKLKALQSEQKLPAKARDLPIPSGVDRELDHYVPLRHEFPAYYGLGVGAVPPGASLLREAQARQLNGYLLVFDQLVANLLEQLSRLRRYFSWSSKVERTYYFHRLEPSVFDLASLLTPFSAPKPPQKKGATLGELVTTYPTPTEEELAKFVAEGQAMWETAAEFRKRRTEVLLHLLARVGRNFQPYLLAENTSGVAGMREIRQMEQILQNYRFLSAGRGRGGDYLAREFTLEALTGMRFAVELLTGMPKESPAGLAIRNQVRVTTFVPGAIVSSPNEPVITNRALSAINLGELIKVASNPDNYFRVGGDRGGNSYELYDATQGPVDDEKVFNFHNTYFSVDGSLDVARLVKWFRNYDRESERVHVIDHLILRPNPKQSYFGLSIRDQAGRIILQNQSWYAEAAMERLFELKAAPDANYAIAVYEPEEAPRKPVFEFRIEASRDGTIIPLTPEGALSFRFVLDPQGPLIVVPAASSKLTEYLRDQYAHLWDQPEQLGEEVTEDFVETGRPPGWESQGKASTMEAWGFYVLQQILETDYLLQYPGPEALGEELIQVISPLVPQFGDPARIVPGAQKSFLYVVWKMYGADSSIQTAFELGLRVLADLGPEWTDPEHLPAAYREQLAEMGRAFGLAWIKLNYPLIYEEPESLGAAIIRDLQLAPPQAEEEAVLGGLGFGYLSRFFLESMGIAGPITALSPPISVQLAEDAIAIFNALLGVRRGAAPLSSVLLAECGFGFMRDYLRHKYNQLLGLPTKLGKSLIHLWEESLQRGGTISGQVPQNMVALSQYLLTEVISTIFLEDTQDPEQLGPAVVKAFFTDSLQKKAEFILTYERQLAQISRQLFPWLIRVKLASGSLAQDDQLAFTILLGVETPPAGESVLEHLAVGFEYYLREAYPFMVESENERGLGMALRYDFVQRGIAIESLEKENIFASVGAYLLSWFVQRLNQQMKAEPKQVNVMLEALVVLSKSRTSIYGEGESPYEWAMQQQVGLALDKIAQLFSPLPMTMSTSGGRMVDWMALGKATFLDPERVQELPDELRLIYAELGFYMLTIFVYAEFPWQIGDNTCLGYAALAFIWSGPPLEESPDPVPPTGKQQTRAPSQDDQVIFSLYLGWHHGIGYVRLQPVEGYFTFADAQSAIVDLVNFVEQAALGARDPKARIDARVRPWPNSLLDEHKHPALFDPYAQFATVLIPNWPTRFQDKGFRKFLEASLIEESPAYMLLNILWLDKYHMDKFLYFYNLWQTSGKDDPVGWVAAERLMELNMNGYLAGRLADMEAENAG